MSDRWTVYSLGRAFEDFRAETRDELKWIRRMLIGVLISAVISAVFSSLFIALTRPT